MKLFLGNSLWNLLAQADGMTKIVLGTLLVASIVCWTIILYKTVLLTIKQRQLKDVLKKAKKVSSLEELLNLANANTKTFPGHLLAEQLNATKELLEDKSLITESDKNTLEDQRLSVIDDMVHQENSYLSMLSVTAAVSPLMGLFGTVWGLMHSFISISEKQSADITTIAPGIAEALLTTIGGLMVAIPVSIMYYFLREQVGDIEHQLNQLSDRLAVIVKKVFIDGKETREVSTLSKKASQGTIVS
ncbi:MAG: biopolymer transport protein ExbB/TolQ [Alteromonas naphthalenivorans]|jgi:biopolymer transport protein ExbB/TolQ